MTSPDHQCTFNGNYHNHAHSKINRTMIKSEFIELISALLSCCSGSGVCTFFSTGNSSTESWDMSQINGSRCLLKTDPFFLFLIKSSG